MYLAMGEFEYTGFRGTERPGEVTHEIWNP